MNETVIAFFMIFGMPFAIATIIWAARPTEKKINKEIKQKENDSRR